MQTFSLTQHCLDAYYKLPFVCSNYMRHFHTKLPQESYKLKVREPWKPETTICSRAPDCLHPKVLSAAGNYVNASYAIREQLKQTLSETNISYIHQSLRSQSQSNECTRCVCVALKYNHRGNRFICIQLSCKKSNQQYFVSRDRRTVTISVCSVINDYFRL